MLSNSSKSKVVSDCSKIIRLFLLFILHIHLGFQFLFTFVRIVYKLLALCTDPNLVTGQFLKFFFAPTGKGLFIFCTVMRSGFEWCKKIGIRILIGYQPDN